MHAIAVVCLTRFIEQLFYASRSAAHTTAAAMSKNSLFTSHTALSDEVMDYFRKLDQKDKIMVEYMYAH
jgi:hypothetical protein